jgi:hypothetical protein
MATKKTSMFTLTERVSITAAGTPTFATIDLGSYVDVGDRQALQVHSVDFIFEGTTASQAPTLAMGGSGFVTVNVTDLNRGDIVFSNDRALVASGHLNYDIDAFLTHDTNLFPDNYGKGSDDGRFIVNDQLYIAAESTSIDSGTGKVLNVTVRVNASIVSLTAKDFMAIAIQSTAADN